LYRSEKDLIREIKGEIIAETQSFQSIKDSVKDEVLAEIRSYSRSGRRCPRSIHRCQSGRSGR